jgi:hypothetical protein
LKNTDLKLVAMGTKRWEHSDDWSLMKNGIRDWGRVVAVVVLAVVVAIVLVVEIVLAAAVVAAVAD